MGTSHLHSGTHGLNLASLNRIKHIEMSVYLRSVFSYNALSRNRGHWLWPHRGGMNSENGVAIEKTFLCFLQHGGFILNFCFDYGITEGLSLALQTVLCRLPSICVLLRWGKEKDGDKLGKVSDSKCQLVHNIFFGEGCFSWSLH